ncbi:hypothetical protein PYW08_015881 [Mythimna loreyi]|uniref:Uncharacterized protein n=1 Tax=Mythimna loreyi TaxID=667449 RepID=A0ACC2QSY4_9NEOP|nr:hypothetical protein PYW08_015881 [Mythimna loreyi]
MFRYFLAFMLINTCYQSLGNPIQPSAPHQLLSKSLTALADQCKSNSVLSSRLKNKINDCAVFVPPYSKKQFQCLIFYDISLQLCSAAATLKLTVSEESFANVEETQDVNAVCELAKDWVFTNISIFPDYKESAEKFIKGPATCGEVCGAEDAMTEANYFCKYFKAGLEILKSHMASTTVKNGNNNAAVAQVVPEPDFSAKADIPVSANSIPVKAEDTKTGNGQIKQTEPTLAKTTPQKVDSVEAVAKSETAVQATSKQTPSADEAENPDNAEDSDVNVRVEDPVVPAPEVPQVNKTSVVQAEKPAAANEAVLPDLPVKVDVEQKPAVVLDNPKPKPMNDEEYADSDPDGDDENDDPAMEVKPEQEPVNQQNSNRNKLVVPAAREAEVSQKEFFPNSMPDDFSDEDNDHFFPFFMTSVILMVLLYVLYHNKSKVSKVFFGLILEGRQSGRRRNSRGHAYRRLDTLEQAMSANTAAPPSKIIY